MSIKVVSGRKVTLRMLWGMALLDRLVYKQKYRGGLLNYFLIWLKNREIYHVAMDTESRRVVGYVLVLPLREKTFGRMCEGELIDSRLTFRDVEQYDKPKDIFLYIGSLVVHPQWQHSRVIVCLSESFFEYRNRLQTEGYRFCRYAVDIISPEGENTAIETGFRFLKESNHGSRIYVSDTCERKTSRKKT